MNVESVAALDEDPDVKGVGHDRIGRIRTPEEPRLVPGSVQVQPKVWLCLAADHDQGT